MTQQSSGADLARQALAAARANAKNTPAPAAKKTRPTIRRHRGEHGDPTGFARILEKLTAEQGWDANISGGSVIDQWPTLCPQYAGLVQAVAYDDTRGRLDLRIEALERQAAALRANRQPESEHRDAEWAHDDATQKAGPAPGSVEESLARARAYARQQRTGRAPRRAFDVA